MHIECEKSGVTMTVELKSLLIAKPTANFHPFVEVQFINVLFTYIKG